MHMQFSVRRGLHCWRSVHTQKFQNPDQSFCSRTISGQFCHRWLNWCYYNFTVCEWVVDKLLTACGILGMFVVSLQLALKNLFFPHICVIEQSQNGMGTSSELAWTILLIQGLSDHHSYCVLSILLMERISGAPQGDRQFFLYKDMPIPPS